MERRFSLSLNCDEVLIEEVSFYLKKENETANSGVGTLYRTLFSKS